MSELTYKANEEVGLIEFFVNGELLSTWCYEDEPEIAFNEFEKVFNAGKESIKPSTPTTPSAKWALNNEQDPHGSHYDCERATLALGDLTDDELANAIFLHGDTWPKHEDLISGKALSPIVYLTAAKERIRWLSRKLADGNLERVQDCIELLTIGTDSGATVDDCINLLCKRRDELEEQAA